MAVLPEQTVSLDGAWEFSLGDSACWGSIQVPGCWEAQGYSKTIDGPAYYRRSVSIPPVWADGQVWIEFGAVSYACQVRINEQLVGHHIGLWTPFIFNVTSVIRPGQENLVEVEVFKPGERYPMRSSLAGFLPDVATSFGGIWQSVKMRCALVNLWEVQVTSNAETGAVRITAWTGRILSDSSSLSWALSIVRDGVPVIEATQSFSPEDKLDIEVKVPEFALWSLESPALYTAHVRLLQEGRVVTERSCRFGFRTVETRDGLVYINGQPVLLRGLLSWGWQPDKIAPAFSSVDARNEIRQVKAMGFNLIKLCLFVPNEMYLEMADEEGVFLWEELPLWLPEVTPELRRQAPVEYNEIMRVIHHHPSLILYSLGCELNREVDGDLLEALNHAVRSQVADALVCENSGSGESYGGFDFDQADFTDYHPYYDLQYFEPLLDNWRRDWLPTRPWIFGEFNDSDGFRDLAEIDAANGGIRPWWLTVDNPVTLWRPEARALIEHDSRLARSAPTQTTSELVSIAAAQSLMVRKYTVETLRKRGSMGGYVITGMRDTPIATSGVLDDLGRSKWPPEAMHTFNHDTILCLDTDRRRRWTHGGDRPDYIDIHCYPSGAEAHWYIILSTFTSLPSGGMFYWQLTSLDGNPLQKGEASLLHPPLPGKPVKGTSITCKLPEVEHACELLLKARLEYGDGSVENEWPVWIFPPLSRQVMQEEISVYDPTGSISHLTNLYPHVQTLPPFWRWRAPLVVTTAWCDPLEDYLQRGGRVLLLQQGDGPLPSRRGPFWRESIKLFESHPIWTEFPHQGYAGMQFFSLASDVFFDTPLFSERIPGLSNLRPILRRLDAREFTMADYVVEIDAWKGKLIACSLRLQGGAGLQPSTPQRNLAGTSLFITLVNYLREDLHG